MRPAPKFDGDADTVARMRRLFNRKLVLELTWRERWALRWRIWMGEGLAIVMVPVVIVAIASALFVLWLIED